MKFGVRECANIVFRAKQPIRIGTSTFQTGQPVLYIDTATTSSMEQSTTQVYAQGGRGNTRLLSWEGEKTLTFSFTDALLSPIGFAILSGAGLFKRGNGNQGDETNDLVHFHMTSGANLEISGTTGTVDLRDALSDFGTNAKICDTDAPIYIMETEDDGSLTGNIYSGSVNANGGVLTVSNIKLGDVEATKGAAVMVDYYIDLPGRHVYEADITPETFGGNYYVEADTLFRDQFTGKDLPANLTFPNVRLQSNFTMTFAGTGDPSTFDFTMDAFPGYTYFDRKKKVLAVLQVVDTIAMGASIAATTDADPVMYHDNIIQEPEAFLYDSSMTKEEEGWNVKTLKTIGDANNHDGTSSSASHSIELLNVGDAVNLKDFLIIEDWQDVDIKTEVRPSYDYSSASSQAGPGLISLDKNDGYIVVKNSATATSAEDTSSNHLTVIATAPKARASSSASVSIGKSVYFDIIVPMKPYQG